MGEIADMMLDGTLCEGCGEYIGSDAGYPQYCCKECEPEGYRSDSSTAVKAPAKTHQCAACGRWYRGEQGLSDHKRDKHGATSEEPPDIHADDIGAGDVQSADNTPGY